ncbi:hypothetical protein BpHYR1_022720 [Brachionus plicatilis]|uniref:Uncharacterized protein n=1 Tax=Brachionus plicatilis TaxID=10195 RepID=A0A3M7T6R6_BRAPC|nr:hypothetical protein BpHYR1_022720 [Brachionus plicatilis]
MKEYKNFVENVKKFYEQEKELVCPNRLRENSQVSAKKRPNWTNKDWAKLCVLRVQKGGCSVATARLACGGDLLGGPLCLAGRAFHSFILFQT